MLEELERLTAAEESFAIETTLSGRTYVELFKKWKVKGCRIGIVFLKLDSTDISLRRIASRVAQGGHDVPKADVLRRFQRGWRNSEYLYRPLADHWMVMDASGDTPILLSERT